MKTKYPIVLVHGIMIKDFKFFKAFGRIEKVLTEQGNKVYTAKIDGFGSIKNNAIELKENILEILKKEHTDKVNIIAHSKGGLDSKYMILNLDMKDNVASLTTMCTPHKGSPIASKLLELPNFIKKFISFWINFWYKIFGDKHPDALKVCEELKRVKNFETECISFSNNVYCQSYSSTLKKSKDDFLMGIPLAFSKYFEKLPSDGLVPNDSSVFGDYKGDAIDDSISHTEIVDFTLNKKKKQKIYKFYIDLAKQLAEKGF